MSSALDALDGSIDTLKLRVRRLGTVRQRTADGGPSSDGHSGLVSSSSCRLAVPPRADALPVDGDAVRGVIVEKSQDGLILLLQQFVPRLRPSPSGAGGTRNFNFVPGAGGGEPPPVWASHWQEMDQGQQMHGFCRAEDIEADIKGKGFKLGKTPGKPAKEGPAAFSRASARAASTAAADLKESTRPGELKFKSAVDTFKLGTRATVSGTCGERGRGGVARVRA